MVRFRLSPHHCHSHCQLPHQNGLHPHHPRNQSPQTLSFCSLVCQECFWASHPILSHPPGLRRRSRGGRGPRGWSGARGRRRR
uniref:Uncharacterized protein n=1 Tax=Arundo donax TaxID=35708 RepID=A0A0A9EJF8_ARUDO